LLLALALALALALFSILLGLERFFEDEKEND